MRHARPRSLPARESVPPQQDPVSITPDLSELVARVELANRLHASGRQDEAQAQYDTALIDYRRLAGAEDPRVLVLEFTQAQTMLRQGDLKAAKAKLVEICERSTRISGADHSTTLTFFDSLAATLLRLGEHDDAKELLVALLEARLEFYSPDNVDATLSTASVLVTHYLNSESWAAAVPVQERIVSLLRRLRGELNPETLLAASLLAVMYVEAGDLPRARVLLQVVSGANTIAFGREHNETLRMFLLLALVLERQDDLLGARAVLERSYAIALREQGEEADLTIRFGTKLAGILLRLQDYGEARRLLTDVLPVSERVAGKNNTTTLTNLNNLAVAIWEQGHKRLAYSVAEELVRRNREAFGSEHARTLQAQEQLDKMAEAVAGGQSAPSDTGSVTGLQIEGTLNFGESSIVLRLRGFQMPHSKQ